MKIRTALSVLPLLLTDCAPEAMHAHGETSDAPSSHQTTGGHQVDATATHVDTAASEPHALSTSGEDVTGHEASTGREVSTGQEATTESGRATFAVIPSPALLVANGGAGEVTLIDPADTSIVGSIAVMSGMHPHHVSVSPDAKKVLITATSADLSLGHSAAGGEHGGHGSAPATVVYQLDLQSGELVSVLEIDATVHNAAFTADGAAVVVAMMEHGMIAGYAANGFAELFTADGFDMPLEVTPTRNNALLIAESGSGTVALFDLEQQVAVQRFEVGSVPVAAWASGGTSYFVAAEEGMQLNHLVEDGSSMVMDEHVIALDGMPGQAMLTPDGSELWVALEDAGKVAILDATTHEVLAQVVAGTKPHGIAFDPLGTRAFVTDEEAGDVIVVDVVARDVVDAVALGGKPNGIVWLAN